LFAQDNLLGGKGRKSKIRRENPFRVVKGGNGGGKKFSRKGARSKNSQEESLFPCKRNNLEKICTEGELLGSRMGTTKRKDTKGVRYSSPIALYLQKTLISRRVKGAARGATGMKGGGLGKKVHGGRAGFVVSKRGIFGDSRMG